MKTCRQVYHHLCENLDQDLESPQCREIKRHLKSCPDCHAYLESLKGAVGLYRQTPVPGVSRAIHARLLHTLKLEISRTKTRQIRPPRGVGGRVP